MAVRALPPTNFAFLEQHDAQLVRLGMLAERYFPDDPNTCLLKLRQYGEVLAQLVASHVGEYASVEEAQFDLLRRLQGQGLIPREIGQLFNEVRRAGNAASHELNGDHRTALAMLKVSWQLGLWFHRTFAEPAYRSGPFIPPVAPIDESEELRGELDRLAQALASYKATYGETVQQLAAVELELETARDEQAFWEQMAVETEAAKLALQERLAAEQSGSAGRAPAEVAAYVAAASKAAEQVVLDEAETRKLVDEQLRQAGWQTDSTTLRYGMGARPEKGKNLAIAEWPTLSGPADYVLFAGLTPLAVVEAKRKNVDVSAALQQAKRYSRSFNAWANAESPGGVWDKYRLPFAFSTNGRPYLRQLETRSGVWFCDLRRPDNLSRALDGWYTPEGLMGLLKQDAAQATAHLEAAPLTFDFALRPYQEEAIRAIEAAIGRGQRLLLVAMATGTGKTKVSIALIYRLLKAQRFRRVLFLVDRSALGEQAANAFKDTRMENLQTFADIFGIKELDDQAPDTETAVHIATVQGMVQRVLYTREGEAPPPVDQYDCIVVDECHRGYLLDRELSDAELAFRGYEDYISKYRRVIEYFDAVKVGLTATPALHTVEIFGRPVYTYSYRDAVIDGYLVDHEPPVQLTTYLAAHGITWQQGETVQLYNTLTGAIDLITAPDEIKIDIEDFNRKVITEPFNRVVCAYLATELDPASRQKTLIFCVDSAHADLVVKLLKEAFAERYGSVDDDAVVKITGNADRPLQLIRRYKNELNPTVAVTVDLLTTGVDVPEICNLVFLRRVNSRILFEQMLGRATRLCPEIGKESFRIFDAVQMYAAIEGLTEMRPVVVDPQISFTQLVAELAQVSGEEERAQVRDQFIAKLQRKKGRLSESAARDFETATGVAPGAFIAHLQAMPLHEIAAWFAQAPDLGEILDRQGERPERLIFVSEHTDSLYTVTHGFGDGVRPEDYLRSFAEFLDTHRATLPALTLVLTRPSDLTRKDLRELALALDREGFSEKSLETAWRETTNQAIAAHILGYIRQAALGDPLLPYDQRVDAALAAILAQRAWSGPQRQWLQRIAAQTKANLVVDREALDASDQIFRREGGGYERLNRIFDGELAEVLERFNGAIWERAA